jgi:putative SOS response-associated peptidase YedK
MMARVETIETTPSYREAFKKRRCLIPADSFYESKKVPGGKIRYAIGMKDDAPFVFAGLWGAWKDPATNEWLRTCSIITGEPNELVAQVHTRMPVILPQEYHTKWLGEAENGRPQRTADAIPGRADEDVANQFPGKQSRQQR